LPYSPFAIQHERRDACLFLKTAQYYVAKKIFQLQIKTLTNDQLDAQILIHLLQSSTCTCFEQYLAHPQEVKLY